MSLYLTPEEHADNPPDSWEIVKRGDRHWCLCDRSGVVFDSFVTRRAAEEARLDGFCARLWALEARWYAGEHVSGWKPYEGRVTAQ